MEKLKFGLILANREIVSGSRTAADILSLADKVEANDIFDSVWVGDALYVNPRLDSLTLLGAIAGRTRRVLLGPACMGSFALRDPLVFAYEWASLDNIARGRCRLIACAGGGSGQVWRAEAEALGVPASERRQRMLENIDVLRHLWGKDGAPFAGRFRRFSDLTLEPKPFAGTTPIWLATNSRRLGGTGGDGAASDIAVKRIAAYADGWMTHSITPEAFQRSWQRILETTEDLGRDSARFDNCLYHNIVVDADRTRALRTAKAYLDDYYGLDFTAEQLGAMLSYGSPAECVDDLKRYCNGSVRRIGFRICASDGVDEQFEILAKEVLPEVNR